MTGAAGTLDDPSEILYALNNNDNFSKFATASYDETTKELVITAKDETMTADDLTGKITSIKVGGGAAITAAADIRKMVTDPVKEEYKGDFAAELYAKGGTKALTEEEAKAELAKGNHRVLSDIDLIMQKILYSIGILYYKNKEDTDDSIQELYVTLYRKAKFSVKQRGTYEI